MSLWERPKENSKEVKKSNELVKERDEHLKKWPSVEAAWNKVDAEEVRPAAEELAVVSLTQNREAIAEANEILKQSIWKRNDIRYQFQRRSEWLDGEIEALNSPVIHERATSWQEDLRLLKTKNVLEKVGERHTVDAGTMIIFKSNLEVVKEAREKLVASIKRLREMRVSSLSQVLLFIRKTEDELSAIDFTHLKEEKEVPEEIFRELCGGSETTVYTTATMTETAPGVVKISKNYDLPVKEFKSA